MSDQKFYKVDAKLMGVHSENGDPQLLIRIDEPEWPMSENTLCLNISRSDAVELGRYLLVNFDEEMKEAMKG